MRDQVQNCDYPRHENLDDAPRAVLTALVVCACTFISFETLRKAANTCVEESIHSAKISAMTPAVQTPEIVMIDPSAEERTELDNAIQACIQEVRAHPMILGRLSYFKLCHTNPTNEEFRTLADSMPQTMKPHLQTIARLVALYPQECPRITKGVLHQLGYPKSDMKNSDELAYDNRRDREHVRGRAIAFLASCGGASPEFLRSIVRMKTVEMEGLRARQVASAGK